LFNESRCLRRGDVPNDVKLDAFVTVDDSVPRADDLSPGDFGVLVPELGREAAGGFPDQGCRMEDGELEELVAVEVLARSSFEETSFGDKPGRCRGSTRDHGP
jgi:hypothetical protein